MAYLESHPQDRWWRCEVSPLEQNTVIDRDSDLLTPAELQTESARVKEAMHQERKTHPAAAAAITALDQSNRMPHMPLKSRISNTHETVMNTVCIWMLYPFIFGL